MNYAKNCLILKQEGREQGTTFKRVKQSKDTTYQNQIGPREQTSKLPLDLELQYTLTVRLQQKDTPTGTLEVPRLTIKGGKGDNGPIPGSLHPFPKIFRIIFPLIIL